MACYPVLLLLVLLVPACFASSQYARGGVAQVDDAEQFLRALNSSQVSEIVLLGNVTLTPGDTEAYELPFTVGRDKTLNITSGGGGQQPVLDVGDTLQLLFLKSGSTLTLSNIGLQGVATPDEGLAADLELDIPGGPTWPTISGEDNMKVIYDAVHLRTTEPCTPQKQQEFALALKTLDQLSPDAIATAGDTVSFVKPVTFPVSILKGNSTEQVGWARYTFTNTSATFQCALDTPAGVSPLPTLLPSPSPQQPAGPEGNPLQANSSSGDANSNSGGSGGESGGSSSGGSSNSWLWPVVGSILGLVVVAAAAVAGGILWRQRRRQQNQQDNSQAGSEMKLQHVTVGSATVPVRSFGRAQVWSPDALSSPGPGMARDAHALSVMWHSRVGVIDGLELGELLGSGSFARCYKGRWKGAAVAVKVMEQRIMPGKSYDLSGEPLLSFTVSHPNTVQAFCLQVVCVRADSDASSWGPQPSRELPPSVVGSSNSSTGGPGGPPTAAPAPAASAVEAPANSAASAANAVSATNGAAAGQGSAGLPSSSKGANGLGTAATAAAAAQQGGKAADENSRRRRLPELVQQGSTASTVGEVVSPHAVLAPGLYETWLVMEFCDRGNLSEAVAARRFFNPTTGQLDQVVVLLSLLDIAQGLEYLHGTCNMMHGDLKGRNVLLKSARNDRRGFVCKLADFGLSRMLGHNQTHCSTHSYGTATHAAPELLSNNKLTKAADVYSFAMIVYEVVAGEEPYQDMSALQIILQVTTHGYRPPLPEGCPPALGRLMQRCWDADPQLRPSFAKIVEDLRGMLRDSRQPRP